MANSESAIVEQNARERIEINTRLLAKPQKPAERFIVLATLLDQRSAFSIRRLGRYFSRTLRKKSDTWILIPPTEYHGRNALVSFPSTLIPEKRDEEALLTHQSCNGALDRLHNFLRALLKGRSNFFFFLKTA